MARGFGSVGVGGRTPQVAAVEVGEASLFRMPLKD